MDASARRLVVSLLAALALAGCDPEEAPTWTQDTGYTVDVGEPPVGEVTPPTEEEPLDDPGACLEAPEAPEIHEVHGRLYDLRSCPQALIPYHHLRFEDRATGRLVDEARIPSHYESYRAYLPSGSYRVVVDPCYGERHGGGSFLVDPALEVDGDRTEDYWPIGSTRTGGARSGDVPLDSGWRGTRLRFLPTGGSEVPQGAVDQVDQIDGSGHTYQVSVQDGDFEIFLPDGTYWVVFGHRMMGPIEVTASDLDLDFAFVPTVVDLLVNGVETGGLVYFSPQGAPASMWRALRAGSESPTSLVPGTYDLWIAETDRVTEGGETLAPSLLGMAHLPGGLVVDGSGHASVDLSLEPVTVDLTCAGQPFDGRVGLLPEEVPYLVRRNFQPWTGYAGYLRVWGGTVEAGVVPGTSGLLHLRAPSTGCSPPAVPATLAPSQGALAFDVELLDVDLQISVDGVSVGPQDYHIYSLAHGGYVDRTRPLTPGAYAIVVYREDGAALVEEVTVQDHGVVEIDLVTRRVSLADVVPPSLGSVYTVFTPLDDPYPVSRVALRGKADRDAATIDLGPGVYEVSFSYRAPDRLFPDLPLVHRGVCLEVEG